MLEYAAAAVLGLALSLFWVGLIIHIVRAVQEVRNRRQPWQFWRDTIDEIAVPFVFWLIATAMLLMGLSAVLKGV